LRHDSDREFGILNSSLGRKMKIFLSLFLCSLALAKPVQVILDVPKEIIIHHTGAILFGLKYADGSIIGSGLFTEDDLRAGIMEKTLQVDETLKIASCSYEWLLFSDHAPNAKPDPVYGKIGFAESFKESLKKNCTVDLNKNEILLSLVPYKLEKLETYVPSNSLINRKAVNLIVIFSPRGEKQDKFAKFSLIVNSKTKLPLAKIQYFLAKEKMVYGLETFWKLESGASEKENKEYQDNFIEIR